MVLLKDAKKLYVGTTPVKAVYQGGVKVWSSLLDPRTIPGLAVWLDASDVGAITTQWPDKSGQGHHGVVMLGPSSTPPAVVPGVLSGLSVVRFTVSESRIRTNGTGVSTDWTVAYVARMAPGGYYAGRIFTAIYPPANLLIGFWNSYQDVFYDNGFATPNTQTDVVPGQWKLYSADGITAGPLTRCFSNGVLMGTMSTGAGWNGSFALSGYDPSTAAESCDCQVAEVLQYNRRLSGAERQQIEDYLRTKWGL